MIRQTVVSSFALSLALLVGGCGAHRVGGVRAAAGAAPVSSVAVTVPPSASLVVAASANAASSAHVPETFVWTRAKEPKLTANGVTIDEHTVVLDARAQVVADHEGIVVAIDGTAWRWETEDETRELTSCSDEQAPRESKVERARLVGVDDTNRGKTRPLLADYFAQRQGKRDGEAAQMVGELTQSYSVTATVGPYAFVREHTWMYACGAHGFWGAEPRVVDLRTGKLTKLAFPDADTAAAKADATKAFVAHFVDGSDPSSAPFFQSATPEYVQYVASEPTFSGAAMSFVNIYTTGVAYVDSASEWGSYAVDTSLPAETPEPLRAIASAPANVVAYAQANPDLVIGGFTSR